MNIDDTIKLIKNMSKEEKDVFFSQEAQKADFKGQTVGQKLYGLIFSYIDVKYPFDNKLTLIKEMEKHKILLENKLSSVVGSDYLKTYLHGLQVLKEIRSQQILKNTQHLYHFSQSTPEEIGEYLTPMIQEKGNAFGENVEEKLC